MPKTSPSNEDQLFEKSLEKKFEGLKFSDGKDITLPRGNSTGSLTLDINLHIPIYEGCLVEIFSNEGGGKTTLVLSILSEAVKRGKKTLFIDQEQSLQSTLIASYKDLLESENFKVITCPTGDDALQIAELWTNQYPGSIVAIDSVDALIPKAVEGKAIGESAVGNLARLMSDGCRKLKTAVGRSKSNIIFINQMRNKITAYGDPNTTSGGKALPFYADQRIHLKDITKADWLSDDNGSRIGHKVRFFIKKNKIAPPFVEGEFPLIYGKGIDVYTELVTLAGDLGVIEKNGIYYMVPNSKGEMVKKPPKTVINMMRADPEFYESTLNAVKELYPETFNNE